MTYRFRSILTCLILLPVILFGQVIFDPPLDRNRPIQFPDTPVGEQSVIMLNVNNNARDDCQVRLNPPGDPFLSQPDRLLLEPMGLGVFTLTFRPQRAGDARAEMTGLLIVGMGIQQIGPVVLIGTGVEENEPQPEILVNPDNFRLNINEDNGPVEERLTISNVGNAALIGEIDIPDIDWFGVEPDEFRIAEDEEFDLTLTFGDNWPDNGDYEFCLPIHSNDPENEVIEIPIEVSIDIPRYVNRVLQLRAGWNMISSNVDFAPDFIDNEGPDMRLILSDIVEQVLIIKDEAGGFCAPPFNFWGLPQWGTQKGYLIKTTEETELTIRGLPIPFNRRIDLDMGWNMIAFYPTYNLEYWWALLELVERDQLILAKNQRGQFYSPEFGFGMQFWIIPCEGILVKVTEDCSFEYPPEPE